MINIFAYEPASRRSLKLVELSRIILIERHIQGINKQDFHSKSPTLTHFVTFIIPGM